VTAKAARKPGRPSDFLPEYPDQAAKRYRLGATDAEIADFVGKDERTVNRWKIDHPEFCQALKDGKLVSDMEVADRLHQRAVGFEYEEARATRRSIRCHSNDRVRDSRNRLASCRGCLLERCRVLWRAFWPFGSCVPHVTFPLVTAWSCEVLVPVLRSGDHTSPAFGDTVPGHSLEIAPSQLVRTNCRGPRSQLGSDSWWWLEASLIAIDRPG